QHEKDMAAFMSEHPEFAADGRGTGAAVRAEAKKGADALAAAQQAARRRALAAGAPPTRGGVAGGPAAPPVDPVLLAVKTQAATELSAARKDLDDKKQRFTDQHPDVRAAEARVASAEAALQKADDAVRAATPPPAPASPPDDGANPPKPVAKG